MTCGVVLPVSMPRLEGIEAHVAWLFPVPMLSSYVHNSKTYYKWYFLLALNPVSLFHAYGSSIRMGHRKAEGKITICLEAPTNTGGMAPMNWFDP